MAAINFFFFFGCPAPPIDDDIDIADASTIGAGIATADDIGIASASSMDNATWYLLTPLI